jgi:class 3 adenylate cyclase
LINQGEITGVLYLENNLVEGAFTEEHTYVLNLLSSQMAISIDNARLYENTKALNISFERFLPADFLSLLQKNSVLDISLGDHMEETMTIIFADIRSFTTRSEKMTPQQNFDFINSVLEVISPIIREHNGFVDKYIGDAIMALFPKCAEDAVRCALKMQAALLAYNQQHTDQEAVKIGIGINTGLVMLGTVGEPNRMNATVISDAVNIASRTESLTKTYQTPILMTEDTYQQLKSPWEFQIDEVATVTMKGKAKEIKLYQVK